MNPTLYAAILPRLEADFGFKPSGKWLADGECPECGKKTAYTVAEAPWVIRCNRLSKCGWERHVKELYDDLFDRWSERHPKTQENPSAAADAYLRDGRGFAIGPLQGWYTQESYWDREQGIGSATVRFRLPWGGFFERIIDEPHRFGSRKATIHGSYKGHWWIPPDVDLATAIRIWITEGIFDAIALHQAGHIAVSALSSNHYPETALAELRAACGTNGRPELVWALDSDKAGRKFTRQWVTRSRAEGWPATAAQIPAPRGRKQDWNDLLQRDRLSEEHLAEYLYLGSLLIAPSAADKAHLIHMEKGWVSFHLDYERRLYWFGLDQAKAAKEAEALATEKPELDDEARRAEAVKRASDVEEIANCLPVSLYFQANEVTDESWYYFRVEFPHGGPPIKNTLTGGQLAAPAEFKKRLLSMAPGAVWTGKPTQLDRLLTHWTYNTKVVRTVDYTGYAKDHAAWIFPRIAIQAGRVYSINDEDYFELRRLAIKSLSHSVPLDLNTDLREFREDWLSAVWACFGPAGLAVLTFWFLSLFAEQIYERLKFFPFLELIGEPGSGKTTLIEFLWKLVGRHDWEGFDPTNASHSALGRSFNQVSNLPVVLIEGDRTADAVTGRPSKSFAWDEVKKLYNRRGFRARGVKNSGNDTYDPPFRGTLVAMQNHPIQADRPVLERFIQVGFTKANHTETTRTAARKLETFPLEQVSGFLIKACCAEKQVLETLFERLKFQETRVAAEPAIKTHRIVLHHALLMAGVEAMAKVLPLSPEQVGDTIAELFDMAVARQKAISSDHPILEAFWELFEDIESNSFDPVLNHSIREDLIAINLTDYAEYIGKRGLQSQAPSITDLRRLFPNSTKHKYLANKPIESAIRRRENQAAGCSVKRSDTVRCWVFRR
jgi:hypothetical protein